jgi:hypothetical protein
MGGCVRNGMERTNLGAEMVGGLAGDWFLVTKETKVAGLGGSDVFSYRGSFFRL